MTDRLEATRLVPASIDDVFALLRDPRGHVEIDSSGMLQDAEGPPVSGVGDRFLVHMDRTSLGDMPELGRYDITVTITSYEEDRALEWTVRSDLRPPLGHRYGYLLAPEGDATRVTAYYDWSDVPAEAKPRFPVIGENALSATLGILERTLRRRAAQAE